MTVIFRIKTLVSTVTLCAVTFAGSIAVMPTAAQAEEVAVPVVASEVEYMNMSGTGVIYQEQFYLPLRSTFSDLHMDLHWKVDDADKIKVNNAFEAYEFYLTYDAAGTPVVHLQQGDAGFPLFVSNGLTYAPLSFFQNIVSNYNIGMSGENLMVMFPKETATVSFWANMNVYQAPVPAAAPAPVATTTAKPVVATVETPTYNAAPTPATPKPSEVAAVKPSVNLISDTLTWPTTATYVSSRFGWRADPWGGSGTFWHRGVDIAAANGTPILAAQQGKIIRAGIFDSYGNCIDIQHPSGLVTRYAHLSAIQVQVGQNVGQGDVIGLMGQTGAATGPHLHFEVLVNGSEVDPANYLKY